MMLFDYRKLLRYKWLFFCAGTLILQVLIWIPTHYILGKPVFLIGPLSLESMMAIPFFYLGWAAFFREEIVRVWKAAVLFVATIVMFMLTLNPVSVFTYSVMVFVMMWWSRLDRKKVLTVSISSFAILITIGIMLWNTTRGYQKERMLAFLNPEAFSTTSGFMYIRVKDLFTQAGWFGQFGEKEFIPSGHTDFVFVSIAYQYGWIVAFALFTTLLLLAIRMIRVSSLVKDPFGKMLIIGGISLFTVQFIYNIAMLLGFLPMLGISLPFISYGLMPTLLNSIIMGVVLSVYRRKNLVNAAA
jgi:cell division protein FtsW (lipid II flippase)